MSGTSRPRRVKHQKQTEPWGLIPHWAKSASIGSRTINARAETVGEKPAFRDALRRRRCLVLADGFYEWQGVGRAKRPMPVVMR